MKSWIALGLCVVGMLAGSNLWAASEAKTIRLNWAISVDASGAVTQLSSRDKVPSDLRERLEHEIRTWRFKPGTLNGQPAATESVLRVRLQATPIDDKRVALRIASIDTGGYYGKRVPPRYPDASVKARRQGLVLLQVRYGGDGRVTDVDVYPGAPHADKPLVDAALASVRQWTFAPELVGGHPLAGTVLVPVCFNLADSRVRPPKCDWSPPGGWGSRLADTEQSGDSPLFDSVLKLETAVAGRTP